MKHILPDDETAATTESEEEDKKTEAAGTTQSSTRSISAPVSPKKTPAKRYKILKLDDDGLYEIK
jgi:hypothetical protein